MMDQQQRKKSICHSGVFMEKQNSLAPWFFLFFHVKKTAELQIHMKTNEWTYHGMSGWIHSVHSGTSKRSSEKTMTIKTRPAMVGPCCQLPPTHTPCPQGHTRTRSGTEICNDPISNTGPVLDMPFPNEVPTSQEEAC